MKLREGSLFTGYGGLSAAACQFFGAETVWTSDIDPGACKIIAHRFPGVPNLGDITEIDWAQVEPVDILTGGWPCQPFSHAGKRLGAADERALWPEVARAIRALRPRYVVLENVAAIVTAGELQRAVTDLATSGYVGSWRCLRAADVGAPHGRNRCFIIAEDADRSTGRQWRLAAPGQEEGGGAWAYLGGRGGAPAADAYRTGLEGRPTQRERRDERAARPGSVDLTADADHRADHGEWTRAESGGRGETAAADADRDGQQGVGRVESVRRDADGRSGQDIAWGAYEPAIRRWERVLGRPVPAPTEPSPRGAQRLSPRFVEFMMGLPTGWVTDVPGLSRNAQLKALGNGVVPQQAFAALSLMSEVATCAA